jgi:hypothetical protein
MDLAQTIHEANKRGVTLDENGTATPRFPELVSRS